MKNIKLNRLLFLAALAIVAILSACPAADSGGAGSGGDSKSGPVFEKLGIDDKDKKKIIAFFSKDISGTPDANKITVKKGPATLKKADYTPTVEKGKLVITLKIAPETGDKYTLELQAGAVKDANGKANIANTASKDKTLTVAGIIVPSIEAGSLSFKANSKEVLTLSFNTDIDIVDRNKINVEVKADGAEEFTATRATSAVNTANGKLLELTLATPAVDDNVYRVKVGVGALSATVSKLANKKELTSSEFTYSTSPILDTANRPYILDNKLVATFNFSIDLKDWTKVKVYKNPAGDNEEISLKEENIAVNDANSRLLEITLPDTLAESEVYRLKLEARAVNEKDNAENENEAIEPKNRDITMGAAPILNADNEPYLSEQKIIVIFNAPIIILDDTKIKYLLKNDGDSNFGEAITPNTTPIVENNNQLVITLDDIPEAAQVYRIQLEPGAITGKNTVPSIAIQPTDKDIIVWDITAVTPVFTSNTKFSVTFPENMQIVDKSKISVESKAAEEEGFIAIPATSAVDNIETNLLELTLLSNAAHNSVYRVKVEAGALRVAASNMNNSTELTSGETTYFTSPILDTAHRPYILNNKLFATFNFPIALKDWEKVKVHRNPDGDNQEINLKQADIAVNNANKRLLEITLPEAVADDEVYRLKLEPEAVNEEGNEANANRAIETRDLDITVWLPDFRAVQPAIDSNTQLSVTFPVAVAIVDDGSKINVINVLEKDEPKTLDVDESKSQIVSSRTIAVDSSNPAKINITLTGSKETTLYKFWKVVFPTNTVETATSHIPNSGSLTTTESDRTKFTDLYSWKAVPAEGSKWSAREAYTSVVFNDKIWVMGGYSLFNKKGKILNDVWSSPDGINWTQMNNTEGWSARYSHASVVFNEKIWVLGGRGGAEPSFETKFNDVWSSTDGINWEELTPPKGESESLVAKNTNGEDKNWWTPRNFHTSVVFDKKIWVLGGRSTEGLNDVWSSIDGSTWVEESARGGASVGWSARYAHTSAAFNGKIWVIGGAIGRNRTKSVWSSDNGQQWTRNTDLPKAVDYSSVVKYKDRLWNFGTRGGRIEDSFFSNASPTNSSWTTENALKSSKLLSQLSSNQAVVFKGRIWLLGGRYDGNLTNKVWNIGPASE